MRIRKILLFIPALCGTLSALAGLPLLEKSQLERMENKVYNKYRALSREQSADSVHDAFVEIEKFFNDLKEQYSKINISNKESSKYDNIPRVLGRIKADMIFLEALEKFWSGELSVEAFNARWSAFSKYSLIIQTALSSKK